MINCILRTAKGVAGRLKERRLDSGLAVAHTVLRALPFCYQLVLMEVVPAPAMTQRTKRIS